MKVILDGDRGRIWIDTAPEATVLALRTHTTFRDTGEVTHDAYWGPVKVFKQVMHAESVTAEDPKP